METFKTGSIHTTVLCLYCILQQTIRADVGLLAKLPLEMLCVRSWQMQDCVIA